MRIPASWKAFLIVTPVLVFIGATTVFSQEPFFKRHPWPLYSKQPAAPSEKPSPGVPLIVSNTHADTAEFTPYAADLKGVIVGNAQWIDYDNDADLDIFVSGYDGSKPMSLMYRNTNGAFQEIDIGIPPVITERGIAWGGLRQRRRFRPRHHRHARHRGDDAGVEDLPERRRYFF